MKNFLILTNEQKDPGFRISKQIQDYIEKNGGKSHRMCEFTRHIQKDMKCITKDTECVLSLIHILQPYRLQPLGKIFEVVLT